MDATFLLAYWGMLRYFDNSTLRKVAEFYETSESIRKDICPVTVAAHILSGQRDNMLPDYQASIGEGVEVITAGEVNASDWFDNATTEIFIIADDLEDFADVWDGTPEVDRLHRLDLAINSRMRLDGDYRAWCRRSVQTCYVSGDALHVEDDSVEER